MEPVPDEEGGPVVLPLVHLDNKEKEAGVTAGVIEKVPKPWNTASVTTSQQSR